MQSSVKLEQMSGDWSHNAGDDASILGTQKIPFHRITESQNG